MALLPTPSKRLIVWCLSFFLCALGTEGASVLASDLKLTPEIRERVTWNDNFFFKEFNDFELRSEPKLSLDYSTERSRLSTYSQLSDFRYGDETKYDRTNYSTMASGQHSFSERLNASLQGGWLQDYSVDTFWDDDASAYGTLIKRNTYNAGTALSYSLTELDRVNVSGNWSRMDYAKKIQNYSDYDMLSGNIQWQHNLLDGRMAVIATGTWQHLEFDSPRVGSGRTSSKQDITQDALTGMVGLYWMPYEKLSFQGMLGVNYTESETKNVNMYTRMGVTPEKAYYYSTGFTGSLDLTWTEDDGSITFSYKQDQQPSTYGELRTVNTVSLSGRYNYTQRLQLFSSIRYSRSKSDNITTNKISRDFWMYTLYGRYRLTDDFSTMLQYSHIRYNNKVADDIHNSNAVFLQLIYEIPISLQ